MRGGTQQEEQQIPQFQGMSYIPQFQDPNSNFQQFPFQQHILFGRQIPYHLTYEGMIAHGMRPTNFGNPPRYIQIHQHQNEYDTEVEEIVPETQQSNPTPESNPTRRQEGKGKKKNMKRDPKTNRGPELRTMR